MKKYLDAKGLSFAGVLNGITMLLVHDRWTQDRSILCSDLNYAEPAVCKLTENVLRFLLKPRIEKQCVALIKKKAPPKKKTKKKASKTAERPAGSSKREQRRETRAPMVGTKLSSMPFGQYLDICACMDQPQISTVVLARSITRRA